MIFDAIFRDRDRSSISVWARENVTLTAPLTKTGPFDVSISRHFEAPLIELQDDRVREVNILKPLRGGGTLIADIWCPWTRSNDPGPFLFLLQTDPIADDHQSKILVPILKSVPAIWGMLAGMGRHEITGRKIEFPDGNHLHCNGPSISNLQTNAFRYLVLDECWLYDRGRMADAEGRIGDFLREQISKILRVSQGGCKEDRTLQECDWNSAYNAGEINEWEIACLSCGHYMQPALSGTRSDGSFWGLVWDKHKSPSGDWDIAKALPTVRFECEKCGHAHIDGARLKSEWNRLGRYARAGDPNTHKKSFHWNAMIADNHTDIADLWLQACNAQHRGNIIPKLQFYQKRMAVMMDEERLLRGGLSMRRVAYDLGATWADEKLRMMHVDCQQEGVFWWTVRACSGRKTRRLGFGKAFSFAELVEISNRFNVPTFISTAGPGRRAWSAVTIDARYRCKGPNGVYAACVRYGWIAMQGDQKGSFWHTLTKRGGDRVQVERSYSPAKEGDPECPVDGRRAKAVLIQFSKSRMNDLVQQLIDNGDWEEPPATPGDEMEAEYSAQMSARSSRVEYNSKTNEMKRFWREGKNDHARDLANQHAEMMVLNELVPDPVEAHAPAKAN